MTERKSTSELEELSGNPFGELEITNPASGLQKVEEKPRRLIDSLPEEISRKPLGRSIEIDPKNHQAIILYGTQAQSPKLLNFSHSMLDHVQNKDVGEIGDILSELMSKLKQVNPDELQPEKRNLFAKLFGKISSSVNEVLSKYQKTGAQIDRITVKLDHCKKALMTER